VSPRELFALFRRGLVEIPVDGRGFRPSFFTTCLGTMLYPRPLLPLTFSPITAAGVPTAGIISDPDRYSPNLLYFTHPSSTAQGRSVIIRPSRVAPDEGRKWSARRHRDARLFLG